MHAGCRAQNFVRLRYCSKLLNGGYFKYSDNNNVVFEKVVIFCLTCLGKLLKNIRPMFFVWLVARSNRWYLFILVSIPCFV